MDANGGRDVELSRPLGRVRRPAEAGDDELAPDELEVARDEGAEARTGSGAAVTLTGVLEALLALTVLGAFVWALQRSGGRDPDTMPIPLAVTAVAAIAARPWRRVGVVVSVTAFLVAFMALALCYVTPTRFAYAQDIGVWPYAVLLFLFGVGFARDAVRRRVLALGLLLTMVIEFMWSMAPWVGFHDSARPMIGTFYWHNQFGAFCAGMAVFGLGAILASGDRLLRAVAVLSTALAIAGCVLSTSRASLAALVVGYVALLTVALLASDTWSQRARRVLLSASPVAVAAAVVVLLRHASGVGTSFLPQVPGGTGSRPALQENFLQRAKFWKAALQDFLLHPWVGQGHGSFGLTIADRVNPETGISRWTHSGPLQAVADGGLLLGLPVVIGCVLLLVFSLRRLVSTSRLRESAVAVGAAAAAVVLLLHACVDFDWNYPSLAGALGLLAAIGVGQPWPQARRSGPQIRALTRPAPRLVAPLVVATGFVAIATGVVLHVFADQAAAINRANALSEAGRHAEAARVVSHAMNRAVPNPMLSAIVLRECTLAGTTTLVSRDELAAADRHAATLARVDRGVRGIRSEFHHRFD